MSEQRSYNLHLDTLKTFIEKPKSVYENIDFSRYSRTGVYRLVLKWKNAYTYIDAIAEEGLFVEIECRHYPDYTYHSFSLQLNYKKHVNIIYQVEVYPNFKLSHRGKGGVEIFGSHFHHLHSTEKIEDVSYNGNWFEWLKYFCDNANIMIEGRHYEPLINDGLGF